MVVVVVVVVMAVIAAAALVVAEVAVVVAVVVVAAAAAAAAAGPDTSLLLLLLQVPDGPQLRLQLLDLSSLEWLPTKTMFPMLSQMARYLFITPEDYVLSQ